MTKQSIIDAIQTGLEQGEQERLRVLTDPKEEESKKSISLMQRQVAEAFNQASGIIEALDELARLKPGFEYYKIDSLLQARITTNVRGYDGGYVNIDSSANGLITVHTGAGAKKLTVKAAAPKSAEQVVGLVAKCAAENGLFPKLR